jgi:hypothetical protein
MAPLLLLLIIVQSGAEFGHFRWCNNLGLYTDVRHQCENRFPQPLARWLVLDGRTPLCQLIQRLA